MENTVTVYERLARAIAGGKQAALVTKYNGGMTKTLVSEDEGAAWDSLAADEGPLTLTRDDGVLTLREYYAPRPRLVILGGGHIALPLCAFGAGLGFSVIVFDDRPSFANIARFPAALDVICDAFENAAKRVDIRKNDCVVIVTRGHRHDGLCLRDILRGEFPRYVGMIGSKRRVALVKKLLATETGETEKLSRLHAPIGLPIGAVTPEEIAVSIIAEIIKVLRQEGPPGNAQKARRYIDIDGQMLDALARGGATGGALVTVVGAQGSTPRETGAKMLVFPDGQCLGSIGGGCAESAVMVKARKICREGRYCLMDIDLTGSAEEDGMVCGGTMSVLIEALR